MIEEGSERCDMAFSPPLLALKMEAGGQEPRNAVVSGNQEWPSVY